MTSAEPIKKGGPYTKKEQEERKKQVYHLYFDKNYSIVGIANMLDVNRNTISDDVKYWYSQFSDEWNHQDLTSWMQTHILKLEVQKMRLLEEAEKTDQIQTKLSIEKLIFTIESKLGQLGLEFIKNKKVTMVHVDPEKEIKEIVTHLITIKKNQDCFFTYEEICYEILKIKKCDELKTESYFNQINDFGLEYCKIESKKDDKSEVYDIKKFAELRGYSI